MDSDGNFNNGNGQHTNGSNGHSVESNNGKKEIRVWCDGCFDLVHYGHANSLRQAKLMGDKLVVGVHNDADITKFKGPPVFTEQERYKMVRAIKWVDEVVEGSTYWPNAHTLKEYKCDFAAHGDDISVATDGRDPYAALKDAGLLRIYKRTEGVSTTDIVGRMLLMTKEHHFRQEVDTAADALVYSNDASGKSPWTRVSQFLQTSNKIVQFSEGREPQPGDRIVYACGDWDLLHPGHVDFLEAARKEGDYLIVGVHSDHRPKAGGGQMKQKDSSLPESSFTADPIYRNVVEKVVNRHKGGNYPIMNLHERTLSVLACRFVSEVVIGAPYHVTSDLIKQFNISVVVHGWTRSTHDEFGNDCYAVPKELGIFKMIDTGNRLSTNDIVQRIIEHRLEFELRNKKKEDREISHVKSSTNMG